jgi:hypothetical protein
MFSTKEYRDQSGAASNFKSGIYTRKIFQDSGRKFTTSKNLGPRRASSLTQNVHRDSVVSRQKLLIKMHKQRFLFCSKKSESTRKELEKFRALTNKYKRIHYESSPGSQYCGPSSSTQGNLASTVAHHTIILKSSSNLLTDTISISFNEDISNTTTPSSSIEIDAMRSNETEETCSTQGIESFESPLNLAEKTKQVSRHVDFATNRYKSLQQSHTTKSDNNPIVDTVSRFHATPNSFSPDEEHPQYLQQSISNSLDISTLDSFKPRNLEIGARDGESDDSSYNSSDSSESIDLENELSQILNEADQFFRSNFHR